MPDRASRSPLCRLSSAHRCAHRSPTLGRLWLSWRSTVVSYASPGAPATSCWVCSGRPPIPGRMPWRVSTRPRGELDAGDTEAGRRQLEVALPITARFAFHYLGSMAARLIVRSDPAGDGMSGPGVSPAPARCGISSQSVWCLRGPVMSGHQRTALTGHGRAGHSLDGRGRGYEH